MWSRPLPWDKGYSPGVPPRRGTWQRTQAEAAPPPVLMILSIRTGPKEGARPERWAPLTLVLNTPQTREEPDSQLILHSPDPYHHVLGPKGVAIS